MEFVDLKKQYARLEKSIRRRIDAVLAHGAYIQGPEVRALEEALASYVGVKHCLACASGTDALVIPLMAWGVGPGDAVFTTPFTFVATAEAVALVGATPVFVDVTPGTFNLDPDALRAAVRRLKAGERPSPGAPAGLKARAVIPVDLFGLPADYDEIIAIAKEEGLLVLEDAAQGLGGIYKGKKAGSFGHAAATSFFPAKPLGCYGDGGAVFTDDDALIEVMRSIRVHGQGADKYENVRVGLNGRLDTIQAAVLLAKLEIFEDEIDRRQAVAEVYTEGLAGVVETPVVPGGRRSAWAQYSVLADRRDHILTSLKKEGVPTAVYYPKPLHLQRAFSALGHGEGDFPVSESLSRRIFSLPLHPYMKQADLDLVIPAIRRASAG
jgi:UDP-2-acetamido-2-deoxy-ribo-hexuluronate aminotransferase